MDYLFEGTITVKEYTQAGRRMLLTRRYIVSLLISWILSIFVLLFLGKFETIMSLGAYAFIFLILFFVIQWMYIPYKMAKDFKKKENMTSHKKWIFDDTYLTVITDTVSIKYHWKEFSSLIKWKDVLLFIMHENNNMSLVLPMRLLGIQAETVISEIERKIKEAALQRKNNIE